METIIKAQNLSFNYPDGTKALKNIYFKIKKGERCVSSVQMVQVNPPYF